IPAAHTNIIETSDYWFLESERFDRTGVRGRISVLSLAAVHDDLADSWARAAVALKEVHRLSEEDARRLCWLDAFGALIANKDRHQYNILFFAEGLVCVWLRHLIKYPCCMHPRAMVKCHRVSSCCRTPLQIRWMFGRMQATQRENFG